MGFPRALRARLARAEAAISLKAEGPLTIFMRTVDASKPDPDAGLGEGSADYLDENIAAAVSTRGAGHVEVPRLEGEGLQAFEARCAAQLPEVRVFVFRYA